MKIQGEYSFDASQQEVWQALLDPEVLTAVMPGCEKLERTGENSYQGALKIKVGPVQGLFQGKIKLDDIDEPNGYSLTVDGRGAPGFVKADATVALRPADGGGTHMTYHSDAQVGGRIASVGQRLLDSSAKAIIKQSLDGLNTTIAARSAAGSEGGDGEPAAAVQKPSQAEFAANVAKEVAKDLIPPAWRPVLIAIGLVLLIVVLYWILR